MKTLGIAVAMMARPILRLVLLESLVPLEGSGTDLDELSDVTVQTEFEIPLEDRELAAQLGEAAKNVRGRVRSLGPDSIVVRRADVSSHPSNREAPRTRLLIEGAVVAAAYAEVLATDLLSGKECGTTFGTNKASLDTLAGNVVSTKKYKEAAAAALAGLASSSSTLQ